MNVYHVKHPVNLWNFAFAISPNFLCRIVQARQSGATKCRQIIFVCTISLREMRAIVCCFFLFKLRTIKHFAFEVNNVSTVTESHVADMRLWNTKGLVYRIKRVNLEAQRKLIDILQVVPRLSPSTNFIYEKCREVFRNYATHHLKNQLRIHPQIATSLI